MIVSKIASAIYNEIVAGLGGYNATMAMSLEQLEDEVVEEYQALVKEAQAAISIKDLLSSINCIEVGCENLNKCCIDEYTIPTAHFEIPQIMNELGDRAVAYIGSVDKLVKFKVYTTPYGMKYHKYKSRGKNKPFVYIDTTPNSNNMYDCFLFNAPMLERVSVVAVFKDPRQVEEYSKELGCCEMSEADNMSWIATKVKENVIKKKLSYYQRALQAQYSAPNDQVAR